MPLADGAEFAGYTIERLLGTGGMGEVYLVQHPRLRRREALKILPASVSADPKSRQRFDREADVAASLWHPHIVAVHESGEHDGQLWITMDFVDGTDAARLIVERYPAGMPAHGAFEIATAIADALDYAHERNVLHRDVKPANILLTNPRNGARRILLADFGIARALDDTANLTATNMVVGSVAYSAPEQLSGKVLDGRTDQYALAATVFHLLTGAPPFGNSSATAIAGHLSRQPPQVRSIRADLGDGIDEVLGIAMSKEPGERFNTCREFAAALAQTGAPTSGYATATQFAMPTNPAQVPPTPAPFPTVAAPWTTPPASPSNQVTVSRRGAMIAGGVGALLAVGLVAFIGARLGQSGPESPTASSTRSSLTPIEPTGETTRDRETVTAPPVTITQPGQPPPTRTPSGPPPGDLGLATPMSKPVCNGQGIVVLGNVTTPGQYASGIQRLLNLFPGASYLRTDQSCPSLRQRSDEGNPIYTVFRPAGTTQGSICAAVRSAGGDAYGKWLDTKTDPNFLMRC